MKRWASAAVMVFGFFLWAAQNPWPNGQVVDLSCGRPVPSGQPATCSGFPTIQACTQTMYRLWADPKMRRVYAAMECDDANGHTIQHVGH